jgi:putative transposase
MRKYHAQFLGERAAATPSSYPTDNDQKYGAEFAQATGIELKRTPYHTPVANAICGRFVGSVRRECLDHILVLGVRPLMHILKDYVSYFNRARPHRGIAQRLPEATQLPPGEPKTGTVLALPVLNGLHYDYPVSRLFEAWRVHGTCHTGLSLGSIRHS